MIKIDQDILNSIDLSYFKRYLTDKQYKYFQDPAGREHYRLLAWLSVFCDIKKIVEVGTHEGLSALALSADPNANVITYDIVSNFISPEIRKKSNIQFRTGLAHEDPTDILAADLIFFDAAHDGVYEKEFYQFLVDSKYKGVLLLDDIHLNEPMANFWNLINLPKQDVTSIGHCSGTGIVVFS